MYPKKELPFFILFTAGLCSFTAMLAMLTHHFPELMGVFAKAVSLHSTHTHTDTYALAHTHIHTHTHTHTHTLMQGERERGREEKEIGK